MWAAAAAVYIAASAAVAIAAPTAGATVYKIPAEAPDTGCFTYDLSSITAVGHVTVIDNSTAGREHGYTYVFALDANVPQSALPAQVAPPHVRQQRNWRG